MREKQSKRSCRSFPILLSCQENLLFGLFCVFCFLVTFAGCTKEREPLVKEEPQSPDFQLVSPQDLPSFEDDMEPQSLRTAVERSLSFYARAPSDRTYPLGSRQVSVELLKTTLRHFLHLAETGHLDRATVAREFDVYLARSGDESTDRQLVTGYYEPILHGKLERDDEFCYPLYGVPSDLLIIELASFDPNRFSGERLTGRLAGNRAVPYYTRAEIDGQGKLEHLGCELAWLKDPVDGFFMHIQGSGMILLPDGKSRRLGYAGANGHRYRSIGKDLLEMGAMTYEQMSLQSIRSYLRAHPEARNEIMWRNESYVFFRWVEEGPLGSLNVALTAGRSIATDLRYHPKGGIAFLEAHKPRLGGNGQAQSREALNRWVLNQDTGGAIKGVGRVDLFCGSGETAEQIAGPLKHPGKVYFLVKKR